MKTIICDIDGTIFKYVRNHHYDLVHTEAQILPGVFSISTSIKPITLSLSTAINSIESLLYSSLT